MPCCGHELANARFRGLGGPQPRTPVFLGSVASKDPFAGLQFVLGLLSNSDFFRRINRP